MRGLVAWQEPDDDFIDRIYARRLFGLTFGIPLQVSPQTLGRQAAARRRPTRSRCDEAGFGEGAIVFRQQPGSGGALRGARTMVNTIPESFQETAKEFRGPKLLDGPADKAPEAPPTERSVGVAPKGDFLTVFGQGRAAYVVTGSDAGIKDPVRIDEGGSDVLPDPLADLAPTGAAAIVWKSGTGGRGAVIAREARSDGIGRDRVAQQRARRRDRDAQDVGLGAGRRAGRVDPGQRRVRADRRRRSSTRRPRAFAVNTPVDFVNDDKLELSWEPALNAIGPVRYTPKLDDEAIAENVARTKVSVRTKDLDDGVLSLQVIATDSRGQETESLAGELKIDRRAPRARATRGKRRSVAAARGRRVRVIDQRRRPRRRRRSAGATASARAGGRPLRTSTRARGASRSPFARATTPATERPGRYG